ncbi:MAG: hypothetical protein U0638_13735 [Phycisphaerales bacterium]
MLCFRLRFPIHEIQQWAAAYTDAEADRQVMEIGALARSARYLTRPQFVSLARWKSKRPSKHYLRNDDRTVEEVTRFALTTPVESLRLRALTLLSGVEARTASAILHLCHPDPYPLMDVRAVWSLGIEAEPKDWSAVWPEYTAACRAIAKDAKTDMRTLDRALWGYSAQHQRAAE